MFKTISDKRVWNEGVRHLKKNDRTLAKLIECNKNMRDMVWHPDHYGAIVQSIIFQQISGAAGDSILRKFKALYRGRLPKPSQFLSTPERTVRSAGISPQKYSYLLDLCKRIEDGRLELKKFKSMPNEEIIEELDEVRGIGRWTAEMFLMFSLNRPDVVPFDDLGLQKAVQRAYKLRSRPSKKRFAKISKPWQPYGTIASLYLWRSMDKDNGTRLPES